MIKLYFITFPVVTIGMFACLNQAHAQNAVAMLRPASTVKIDGTTAEWGATLAQYDSKSKLSYTIASDDSMIYIVATSVDRLTKSKMMFGGLTVSLNTEGKKKKAFSITYPSPGSGRFMPPAEGEKPMPPTGIKISGFKDIDGKVTTTENMYGFKASGTMNEEYTLTYEMAIPVKLLGAKPGADLFINISINGFNLTKVRTETATSGTIARNRSGGRSSGRSSNRDGESGASLAGGSGDAGDDMAESMDFWIKTTMPVH